ncbi:hypothetical protein [Actinomadura sp. HBU206391]|uniref:hypothetical protein n=1 Tax=Actinomadura sp. HBU206391 TaxID=2731692 RepID=UPI00164F4D33|nr:hypothetical protein [Actinomadura sp. HBU206391]MBC6459804.1 hypothetical protein [Actinomadura sp. HBU206391]
MPATLALTASPSAGIVWPDEHADRTAVGEHGHSAAKTMACSLKAPNHVRKGTEIQALGTGLRPKKNAQLWIEGQKVAAPHRINKNGHVRMSFRVSQAPGQHPVWITDGVNRCDIPGGMMVKK